MDMTVRVELAQAESLEKKAKTRALLAKSRQPKRVARAAGATLVKKLQLVEAAKAEALAKPVKRGPRRSQNQSRKLSQSQSRKLSRLRTRLISMPPTVAALRS
jgi:hypothetical protein